MYILKRNFVIWNIFYKVLHKTIKKTFSQANKEIENFRTLLRSN